MGKYFFYTDPSKLDAQMQTQAFGPFHTGNSAASGDAKKDTYRTTNLHTTTNGKTAPVIAVCNGVVCVQEDSPSTYSIILKPGYQPPFDFPYIKYFIYKGVKPISIVNGNSIDFSKKSEVPFIKDIFDSWKDPINNDLVSDSKGVLGLAYEAGLMYDIEGNPVDIFQNEQSIDNFFYYPNPDFQLPSVKAGEKIGEFASEFGFEIVLERLGYEPKIELARTFEHFIEVDAISNPLDTSNPTNADYFLHWHEKEACLNYIDPCAFYGSFCGTKVYYQDTDNNKREKCNRPKEIYDGILSKVDFWNKNKIYLDLRNDYGYSLDYYKDYGDTVSFVKGNTSIPLNTSASLWPILSIEIADIAPVGDIIRDKFFRTQIRLPHNGMNNVPLVFLSKAYVKNFGRLRRKHRVQFLSKTMDPVFLEPIDLTFITAEDAVNEYFISNYYKLNLYDKDRANNPIANPLGPSKEYYLNGLFKPLDLKQNLIIKNDKFRYTIWHEEVLVDQTEYGGPQYIAQLGIAEDEHHITLFAFPYYFVHGGFTNVTPDAFTTFATQSKESNKMFLQEIFDLFKRKELRKQELEIDISGTIEELDTVVVQNSPFSFLENALRANENPEDYVFIMFDKAEYEIILNRVSNNTGLPQSLSVYLKKDTITNDSDEDAVRYTKIVLDATRYKNSSGVIQLETININKNIFEYADIK